MDPSSVLGRGMWHVCLAARAQAVVVKDWHKYVEVLGPAIQDRKRSFGQMLTRSRRQTAARSVGSWTWSGNEKLKQLVSGI